MRRGAVKMSKAASDRAASPQTGYSHYLAKGPLGALTNQKDDCPGLRHFWARDYLSQEVQNLSDKRASAASVPAKGDLQLSQPQESRSRR